MADITSLERNSVRKGRKEGLERGRGQGRLIMAQENVLEALEVRFDRVPPEVREGIRRISSLAICRRLLRTAIQAKSMEVFEEQLIVLQLGTE